MKTIIQKLTPFRFIPLVSASLAVLIGVIAVPTNVIAGEGFKEKVVVVSQDEVINETYFAGADEVTISGIINGDAYISGGNVLFNGTINGDLIVAGGNVTVSGTVSDDVRAAGGQVLIDGTVGKNITVAGGNVTIDSGTQIGSGVVAAGGNLVVNAQVPESVYAGGGSIRINAPVGKNAYLAGGNVILGSQATIGGDVTYWSENQLTQQEGAVVSGQTMQKDPAKPMREQGADNQIQPEKAAPIITGAVITLAILKILSSFLIGFLLLQFLPVYMKRIVEITEQKPWPNIGIGFLALVVTPIAGLILLATVIGIPLALILFACYFIGLYLAHIIVSVFIGQKLFEYFKKDIKPVWALLTGIVVLTIAEIIPIIGGLITFVVTLVGLGALVLMEKEKYNQLREKKLI